MNTTDAKPASHTPGPWLVDADTGEHRRRLIEPGYHFIDAGKGYYSENDGLGFRLAGYMSLADATLIAAAPELLNALEYLLSKCEPTLVSPSGCDRAKAAIAKAKGQAI